MLGIVSVVIGGELIILTGCTNSAAGLYELFPDCDATISTVPRLTVLAMSWSLSGLTH